MAHPNENPRSRIQGASAPAETVVPALETTAKVESPAASPAPEQAAPVSKPAPWLITAWPGMGNVAVISAVYMIEHLGARPVAELSAVEHFDVDKVDVKDGIVEPASLPRNVFYRWTNPSGRDLVFFVGEAQPSSSTRAFAHALLEQAVRWDVGRVITIASMASQLHPSAEPEVSAVATDQGTLDELRRLEVKPLEDGQIGGLNGVMLGVAAERKVPGVCLLGEIPYFAAGVPNPKAAMAVLEVLTVLAGIDLDLGDLAKHSAAMEKVILEMLKRLRDRQGHEGPGEEYEVDEEEDSEVESEKSVSTPAGPKPPGAEPKTPDFATRSRIEQMFEEARKDRTRAVRLKEDLDRLGVFKLYENRFLDLFKRAG